MAIVPVATWKLQNAAIATALTTMYKDSGAIRVADEISNPHHPLRNIVKGLKFARSTGVWTSDDDYIDLLYAGGNYAKSARYADLPTIPAVDASVTTATVETAAPTQLILTLSKAASGVDGLVITVGGTRISTRGISYSGSVVTITLGRAIVAAEVVLIAFATAQMADLSSLSIAAQAVTNNVV